MARTDRLFALRLPIPLRQAIEKAAKANRRSITAELVVRLERTVEQESGAYPAETRPRVVQVGNNKQHVREPALAADLQRELAEIFKALPRGKQEALLELLRKE